MPEILAGEIARRAGGTIRGDEALVLRGVASLAEAGPDQLGFLALGRYADDLRRTHAGAVLVRADLRLEIPDWITEIRVREPHATLVWVMAALYPPPVRRLGIHPTAVVADDALLGSELYIGPYAVVEQGAELGDGVSIGAHTVVGEGCRVGAGTTIHPHVTLYPGVQVGARCVLHSGVRLGADGFGYAFFDGRHQKLPQVGRCVIGDDIEIGANSTIDRGSIGDTRIGDGTKVDNLVQIGHNVSTGRHVIVAGMTGIAGSAVIGDGVVIGGQAAIGGHLEIGAGARVAGRSAVMADVAAGATVSGYPARPHSESKRAQAATLRLPQLVRRVQQLEARLEPPRDPGSEKGSSEPV